MRTITTPLALTCLAVLAAPAAPAAAGDEAKAQLEVNIEKDGKETLHLEIGSSWLGTILATAGSTASGRAIATCAR